MPQKNNSGGMSAIFSTLSHVKNNTDVTRAAKALKDANQKNGFDCPGCAWPDPKNRSKFEFCENGAKAIMAAATNKKVDGEFFNHNSIAFLRQQSDYFLNQCGRIITPAVKFPNQNYYQPLSYEEIFSLVASQLDSVECADDCVFYTSGRTSNEAAFLYQLFARLLGTNNLPDCSNLCHESSGVALKSAIGIGKGTVQLEDFLKAQVIILIGHNPSTNHPRMLSVLREARMKGAKIVVINPLIEPGLLNFRHPQKFQDLFFSAKPIASHYYQVKLGGDLALFYLLGQKILRKNNLDFDFIDNFSSGFDNFKNTMSKIPEHVLKNNCGLEDQNIEELANIFDQSERTIFAWGMGVTQNKFAVKTIEAIASLAFLKGQIGKPGAGLCPVRGHSNVQGNRSVGITEKPSEELLKRLEKHFAKTMPKKNGRDVVESIKSFLARENQFFMSMGGNFLSASPDYSATKKALTNCQTTVFVSTKLNRSHLYGGKLSIILPCLTRVEKDLINGKNQAVSVENSMGIVHGSRGTLAPAADNLLSEVAIICELAKKFFPNSSIDWQKYRENYGLIRDEIETIFDGYIEFDQKITKGEEFNLPNGASQRIFNTPTSRAQFTTPITTFDNCHHELFLTTIRSHDQFNTAIYGLDDRYRGVKNSRRVIFLSPVDIDKWKLKEDDLVDIISLPENEKRVAKNFRIKSFQIKPGCAAAYFPEANILVPLEETAISSNTPSSKKIPIKIIKSKSESFLQKPN